MQGISQGYNSHKIIFIGKTENPVDLILVLQYLAQPDGAKIQGFCGQQHILNTGSG